MSDARRESRYYDAMVKAGIAAGSPLAIYQIRAAMAVADEEISAELSTQDGYTAKMRDEIERWRIENARLRAELDETYDCVRELQVIVMRVRAVLDRWRDGDIAYPYLAVRDALNAN